MFNFLFRPIYETKPTPFGLDISDRSLKLIRLAKFGDEIRLRNFGEMILPEGVVQSGEIKKVGDLAENISKFVHQTFGRSSRTRYVVCSLPEEKGFVRLVQLPKMSDEEMERSVLWEMEAVIPLPLDEVYFDWKKLPSPDKIDHFDVIISAFPKKIVDDYVAALKKAALTPVILEIESQAVVRSAVPKSESETPILIVDIGATRTSFIIFSGQAIRFTSTIAISGKNFNATLIEKLKVSPQDAEILKKNVGLDETKYNGKVFRTLLPIVDEFTENIRKYIDYYHLHSRHEHGQVKEISKILLCGGDSNLIGFAAYMSMKLKMPVELANPWTNILKPPLKEIPGLPYARSLSFTTAIGLALRGIKGYFD